MIEADARYAEGIALFREGRWFEAHEALEELWRATPHGEERVYLQGLIQLAVCLEHWRRGNPRGARGQLEKARSRLDGLPDVYEGLALGALLRDFAAWADTVRLEEAVRAQMAAQLTGAPAPRPPEMPWAPSPHWVEATRG
jgi:predicted metal-dependent hydrolase